MSDSRDRTEVNQLTIDASSVPERLAGTGSGPALPPSRPQVDPYIGRTLDGRYLVEHVIGEGGMGVVYLGRHKVIDKRVAIKVLRSDMAADAEMVERFLNEARAASRIGNPHIVDISDFGRLEDGSAYFVMEFLDGQSLGDLMVRSGVIAIARLVHIAKQIARGLAAAHASGIVHRDLKPDNVMLVVRGDDRDFAKILDFGIAKVSSEGGRLTRAGRVFGTPHYMSPEQAAGVPVDQRTDIYALGVILYEMASGKVPFDADNFMGILTQHMYKSPAPIRALVPQVQNVPPGLEAIVLKCLSKRVELRYQSMEELAQDLERVERGVVPEAVQEMMGRSGGFNVPADYFRKQQVPGGPTLMPATPHVRPQNTALKGVVAAAATVTFLIIAALVAWPILAASRRGPISPVHDPPALGSGSASAVASATDPLSGPLLRTVQIVTVPPDAIVFEGARSLGPAPVTIGVPPNGAVTIRIEHAGYVSMQKTLDGVRARENISLERDPGKTVVPAVKPPAVKGPAKAPAPSAPTAPAATLPPASTGRPSDCLPEDWDMFAHVCKRR